MKQVKITWISTSWGFKLGTKVISDLSKQYHLDIVICTIETKKCI